MKYDACIGTMIAQKIEVKNWSDQQQERAIEICKRLKPAYKKINAEHICNLQNVDKVLSMSRDFGFMNIKH